MATSVTNLHTVKILTPKLKIFSVALTPCYNMVEMRERTKCNSSRKRMLRLTIPTHEMDLLVKAAKLRHVSIPRYLRETAGLAAIDDMLSKVGDKIHAEVETQAEELEKIFPIWEGADA